jgi:hypothetical protein
VSLEKGGGWLPNLNKPAFENNTSVFLYI